MNGKRPNCYHCGSFYITHDPARPYGCRAMKFKSVQLPAQVVFAASGEHCLLFKRKTSK